MKTTNRDAMSETFKATGRRVAWSNTAGDMYAASAEAVAWDGAASTTTGAVYIQHRDMFCYVEIRETGRSERFHSKLGYGMKGLMRFTGADDSGEWVDVVLSARR